MKKMKKMQLFLVLVTFLSFSLAGCTNNEDAGTVTGAIAGGLLGSTIGQGNGKILAVMGGALAGAYIGNAIGRNMDENDYRRMNEALEENSLNQPAYWRNDRTGINYEVVPVRDVTYRGNQYCREYRTMANINGRNQTIYGTACRQPDGSWHIVN
jgi:surface antigen